MPSGWQPPDGSRCYRTIHIAPAVYTIDDDELIARAEKADRSGVYEFEIKGFEILHAGAIYD